MKQSCSVFYFSAADEDTVEVVLAGQSGIVSFPLRALSCSQLVSGQTSGFPNGIHRNLAAFISCVPRHSLKLSISRCFGGSTAELSIATLESNKDMKMGSGLLVVSVPIRNWRIASTLNREFRLIWFATQRALLRARTPSRRYQSGDQGFCRFR